MCFIQICSSALIHLWCTHKCPIMVRSSVYLAWYGENSLGCGHMLEFQLSFYEFYLANKVTEIL